MAVDTSVFVESTAVVEPGAKIGTGTKVWHHAHVREGATVGEGCSLGKNVFVDRGARVGNWVKVQNNVSVYSGVTVGDGAFLGPGVVFTNDLYPRATAPDWELTETHVGEGASLGANCTIVCGVSIGRYATIAAGSVVTRSVDDFQLVRGNPARPAGWVCRCGRPASASPRQGEEPVCERCSGSHP